MVSTVKEYKNALANVQSYSWVACCDTITAPVSGVLPSSWAFVSSLNFLISWSWKRAISKAANLHKHTFSKETVVNILLKTKDFEHYLVQFSLYKIFSEIVRSHRFSTVLWRASVASVIVAFERETFSERVIGLWRWRFVDAIVRCCIVEAPPSIAKNMNDPRDNEHNYTKSIADV